MLGIAAMLASCSQSDEGPLNTPDNGTARVTLDLSLPDVYKKAVDGTAEEAKVTRYICAVYKGSGSTLTSVSKTTQPTGSFVLTLEKDVEYTLLFWADCGDVSSNDNYYDANNLRSVTVKTDRKDEPGQIAYYAKKICTVKADEEIGTITMKHAVAKIVYHNTYTLLDTDNTLKMKYSDGAYVPSFDVSKDSQFPFPTMETTHTFTGIGAVDGIIATDYIFASNQEKKMGKITLTLNNEPDRELSNVPFRENYITTVKGTFSNHYEAEFTVSNELEEDWIEGKEETLD